MLRTPQYKFIKNYDEKDILRGGGETELYDLISDPLETNNLATDPGHAAILKELAAQHAAWQTDLPPVPVITGVAPEPAAGTPVTVEEVKRKDRKPKSKREE